MDIQNSEKALGLLKMKANVENLLELLCKSDDYSVIISAKTKDKKACFVFLDKEGINETRAMLSGMQSRIENELEGM